MHTPDLDAIVLFLSANQREFKRLSSLCVHLHQHFPNYVYACLPLNARQKEGLIKCSTAIESLPDVFFRLIRGIFLRLHGCSMEDLDRMIERMTLAALEAANQAAVKQT